MKSIEDEPMDFGGAIHQLKLGQKVARAGWNGKGMFYSLCQAVDSK